MSDTKKNLKDPDEVILGSGDLYIIEFDGTVPDDNQIETEDNRAGLIKAGATLSYSSESQEISDDMGYLKKTTVTKEDVKFKTGVITWADAFFQMMISTARIDYTTKPGHRITKIGGLKHKTKKNFALRFVHIYDDGRKLRVTVTGRNTAEAALAFATDNPTQIDAEISAQALDQEGTLVIIDQDLKAEAAQPAAEGGES